MKVGDLRIGNWYNSVKWNVPVRCDLTDLYNLSANADGADDDPPINEMFEPIPLTEEWMTKFDFVKEGDWVGLIFKARIGIRFFDGNPAECDIIQDNKFISFKFEHIKYVHQLQNLYYVLYGEELIIK
jgi:hypothetical protein